MPLAFLSLLLIAFALVVSVWLTFSVIGVVFSLAVAALVGWAADKLVPGKLPYGWLGAMVAGLAGSWLGSMLFGYAGPTIGQIPIFPAFAGAVLLAFVVQLVTKQTRRERTRIG
jgi:uncharacterized membrane protein YeaQ/YmgE (transglycosylase-associated protein family)